MIVVCGLDNTGKTSLVNHLVKRFNLKPIPKFEKTPPSDKTKDEWVDWMANHLANSYPNNIADRMLIDEFIYGPILRKHICLGKGDLQLLLPLFQERVKLLIVCQTDPRTIITNFESRPQLAGVKDHLLELHQAYGVVLNLPPFACIPKIFYNYKVDSEYEDIDSVIALHLRIQLGASVEMNGEIKA
jgi:hypothetical protein